MFNEQNANDRDKTSLKEAPFLYLKGFLMGTADVIPGVSGGTLALITGIYQRLINAISSVNGEAAKAVFKFNFQAVFNQIHWRFLLVLLTGIFSALVFFTRIVPLQKFMFTHPELIYGLFFGLIGGSIVLLYNALKPLNTKVGGFLLLGITVGYYIVTLVPTETPETWWFTFISGAIAITAMILPGISGSFILLILRKYSYILSQVEKLGGPETTEAMVVLFFFFAGLVTGILAFSRVLSWLLSKHQKPTLAVLTGFMLGSLVVIWPFQERSYEATERTKWYPESHETVLALQAKPDAEQLMEFKKLGAVNEDGQIAVITVKKKLIQSKPFLPSWTEADKDLRITQGKTAIMISIFAVFAGLGLVWIIGRLADK